MADIRVATDFFDHPKTLMLYATQGADGVLALLKLWAWAATNRSKGLLTGLERKHLAAVARCSVETIDAFINEGFIDETARGLKFHDWKKHQGYAFYKDERSAKARKAAEVRWGSAGKDKGKTNKQTRSDRMREAKKKGNHTKAQWDEMVVFFSKTCVKCSGASDLENVDKDHVIPIYQGGSNGIDNIQPLCATCNAKKGSDNEDYRVSFCDDNGLLMPTQWLPIACTEHASTPTPSPIPVPPPEPKKKPSPKAAPTEAVELAKRLGRLIYKRNPKTKALQTGVADKTFNRWGDDIDKAMRIDGRTISELESVIDWCQGDDFWHMQILSGAKLREKYDTMFVRMGSDTNSAPQPKNGLA